MISKYVNLYFPFCSLVVNVVLVFLFFSKRKIKNLDNSIYAKLLVCGLIESNLMFSTNLLVNLFYTPENFWVFKILNKVLYSVYIIWLTFLFVYIYKISVKEKNELKKSIIFVLDIILITVIFCSPIELYYKDNLTNSFGTSSNVLYFGCALYLVGMFIISIFNFRKSSSKKKYIPFFILMFLMTAMMIIRLVDPLLNLSSNVFSLVLLVMYFTIENPDMKLLEEVNKAKEISDNANEEKTLFLYNMTNEIRGITREIDSSANAILDETDNKKIDVEFINNEARSIKGSASKFSVMTNEVLDVSAIDSASIKVYNKKYNVKLLIKQLITSYKKKCEEKGLSFRNNIDLSLPEFLYGDSVNLKKVLDIILDNSYKYTDKGYIELNVNTVTKNDVVRLVITIEDSGCGMKAEDLNRIMNTRKEDKESTNLNSNLYNAKKLITLMGGTILPNSTYGKGTTFKIILDQKIYQEEQNLDRYNNDIKKWRILLVDDNKASQKIAKKVMANTSIELDIVSFGKECLEKIRSKEKYDLILLDEEMSPLDGKTVMKKLNEIRYFNSKVILLTKNSDYEYNDDYLKYGFADFILKPINKEKVLEKIGKFM